MNRDYLKQHTPDSISRWLSGVFDFSQIKWGNIKKGEGDVVIINLGTNPHVSIEEYLAHTHSIGRIEQVGIYTNVYFSRDFFRKTIELIAIP